MCENKYKKFNREEYIFFKDNVIIIGYLYNVGI